MTRRRWILFAGLTTGVTAAVWIFAQRLPDGPFATEAQPAGANFSLEARMQAANDSVLAARIPTPAEIADLQSRADAACLCDRTRAQPWGERCWGDYYRAASRFALNGGVSSPCGDEATATECFGPSGTHPHCVTTLRTYRACSDAEAQTRLAEAARRHANTCSG